MKVVLPNVRKVIIPDPGYTLIEADLKGADAQVVAWEAEDDDLKAAFRAGLDVHTKNAEDMWGSEFTKLPLGSHARDVKRQNNKVAVHLTNYGGSSRAIAMSQGWTIHESELFQRKWFSLHPGIKQKFQARVDTALNTTKTVENRFGFKRPYFDRPSECYTEALAWIPQSTVALNTYLGWFQLEAAFPIAELLLQVHDSVVFQVPTHLVPSAAFLAETLKVETPYDDPLFIPWDLKSSTKSWGDVEKMK